MSKDVAKKLIAELQENEELRMQAAAFTDKNELVKKLNDEGYDVTLDELIEADSEHRKMIAEKTDSTSDELSADELASASGGEMWICDEGKDGHELFCLSSYHGWDYSREHNDWCTKKEAIDRATKPAVKECGYLLGDYVPETVMCRYQYIDENGKEHGVYLYC